jgi:hypothetical protein
LLKTRHFEDYQLFLNKFWRSAKMTMENHQSGKSTVILLKNIQFQVGLTDRDFDRATLKRIR